ncbi:MAG: cell division protein ZapA [Bacteroidales bacterium]|jgi:cell division protein ZapA|nr:cell division protein ZapA [Bacteroidales bacterium]HOL97045.1 cell division protein ZapA [Bacteroidales bacterium]HOM35954.1 cell division protein ZapA [Bacteroidales bacterium]HPD23432.1 cell division protein ZapA [Bacteroidales bacterium]HRS99400.1 cell division protein ZapA [Bacteroidales bacterium]
MDEKLNIVLKIGDREYPVSIERDNSKKEELLRKAAGRINELLENYRNKGFKNKDMQDYMAMSLLQFVIKLMELEQKENLSPIINDLKKINFELEEVLNQE